MNSLLLAVTVLSAVSAIPPVAAAPPLAPVELAAALQREPAIDLRRLVDGLPAPRQGLVLEVDEPRLQAPEMAARLREALRGRIPVVVWLDGGAPTQGALLKVLGARPRASVVLLAGRADGTVEQIVPSGTSVAVQAAAMTHAIRARPRVARRASPAMAAQDGGGASNMLAPKVLHRFARAGADGQVDVLGSVLVVRNVDRGSDVKTLWIKSRTRVRPALAGITDGSRTGMNLWASYLPTSYAFAHQVRRGAGAAPVLDADYRPVADGRTRFDYNETRTRGFSIAGSVGGDFGAVDQAQQLLWTAQSPFSINAGFEYSRSETLSHSFFDYSLEVTSQQPRLAWRARLDPRLGNHLLFRPTAGLPVFTPRNMTPMMRGATFDALSSWVLPGSADDTVTVQLQGGFELHEDRWWYQGAQLRSAQEDSRHSADLDVDVDLGSWHLAREIPVLIQSAAGRGRCIAASPSSEDIAMQSCRTDDPFQMWGYDQARRYRNLGSGRCLAFVPDSGRFTHAACAIDNTQLWEWRADRLHSLYDTLWRVRLTAEETLVLAPRAGETLDDFGVNQFNALDIPWSSYPGRPSINDTMPNRRGVSPKISKDWVKAYGDVPATQRWQLQVITRALQQ